MKLFSLIAVFIYCSVSLFMAVRLLLLARRTRELPELMIGCAFLFGGMIGYPFNVAAGVLAEASKPDAANVALVTSQVGMALAAFFLLLSWQRIFAPTSRSALVFTIGWGAFIGVMFMVTLKYMTPGSIEHLKMPVCWGQLAAQGGCYAILGWASFGQARMLTRRAAIGLADPIVANRLFLWGCSNVAITTSYSYVLCAGWMLRNDLINIYQSSVVAGLGLTSACFMTLAFFPPQAYLARIRSNAAAAGA